MIVAGVTLALGADALYEAGQDRAERARILGALDSDLRLDSLAYARAVGGSLDRAVEAAAALLALVEDPTRHLSGVELGTLIRESILIPPGQKETVTFREITATGSIGLIDDPDLREALLRYYSRPFTGLPAEMWASYISDVSGPYERSLRQHMGSGYLALQACSPLSEDYEGCLQQPSTRLDLDRLRSDPEFVERLVGITLWAGRFRNFVSAQAAYHREVAGRIAAAIGTR